MRYNLDPFKQYSDEEIWNAIEKAHLKETVSFYRSSGAVVEYWA